MTSTNIPLTNNPTPAMKRLRASGSPRSPGQPAPVSFQERHAVSRP